MASRSSHWREYLSENWFPFALILLLCIAVPGFLLFFLHLFGYGGVVNGWLENKLNLTFNMPLAWGLGLILLMVPFALILLYFLKLKRKPISVPSTFLWKKSIEDLHVNSLFQWLRQNVLLLLQLSAILALIYAVMDLRVHGGTRQGQHYILMIDNSASMSAIDVEPNRLEWAKAQALKEIDAATDNDSGMVIVFNSSAEIRQSYTNNKGALRSAVNSIQPTQRPTRIDEALSLADSLANPTRSGDDAGVRPPGVEAGKERTYVSAEGRDTVVHLFSDGRFPDLPEFALGKLAFRYHAAGEPGPVLTNNLALVTMNALRDEDDPSRIQIFCRALNYRMQPVEVKIELEVEVNGRSRGVFERVVKLPGRLLTSIKEKGKEEPIVRDEPGAGAAVFDLTNIEEKANTVAHARIVGAKDVLPLDDEAWLVVGVVRKARVLWVGDNNVVLQSFFDDDAARQVANITRLTPADLKTEKYTKPVANGEFDLVIFDRCAPEKEEEMPAANTFFIGRVPPTLNAAAVTKVSNPQILGWMGKHSIMRYLVGLQEIGIDEALLVKELPPRTPHLLEGRVGNEGSMTLLFPLTRDSFTDLVLAFPLLDDKGGWNTNWPLHPSLPLFLRNVLYALGSISDGSSEETVQPGQVKVLRPDVALSEIEITDPASQTHKLTRGTRPDFTFGQTDVVGPYRVSWDGNWQRSFAVNLLDPEESNLDPRAEITIGAEEIRSNVERKQPRELWKWLVLLALTFLLAEWYIYNRRIYV